MREREKDPIYLMEKLIYLIVELAWQVQIPV